MVKTGDTFKIGQICQESGIYKVKESACKSKDNCDVSSAQYTIPLAKGDTFPPCKTCKSPVVWEFVKKA